MPGAANEWRPLDDELRRRARPARATAKRAGAVEVPLDGDDLPDAVGGLDVDPQHDLGVRRPRRPARRPSTVRATTGCTPPLPAGAGGHDDLAVDDLVAGGGRRLDAVLDPCRQVAQRLVQDAEVADGVGRALLHLVVAVQRVVGEPEPEVVVGGVAEVLADLRAVPVGLPRQGLTVEQ